jgi:hypothetical protein
MILGVVAFLFRYKSQLSEKVPEYSLYFFAGYVLFGFLTTGGCQTLFAESSRNMVSWIALALCGTYYTLVHIKGNVIVNFVPALLALVMSILGQGRAGIITSSALFVFVFLYSLRNYKRKKTWVFLCLTVLTITSSLSWHYRSVIDAQLEHFREHGITYGSRLGLYNSYMNQLNTYQILFGVDISDTEIALYNMNPHNSFLAAHQHLGIIAIVPFVFFAYAFIQGFKKGGQIRLLSLIFLFILARISSDTLAFLYPSDYVLYFMAISLLSSPEPERADDPPDLAPSTMKAYQLY